jgi:hypothetical protein
MHVQFFHLMIAAFFTYSFVGIWAWLRLYLIGLARQQVFFLQSWYSQDWNSLPEGRRLETFPLES